MRIADFIIYVIDVAGGDKVPRKGGKSSRKWLWMIDLLTLLKTALGPGITQSDLLIINKTDLAPIVGADLDVMDRDARKMR